MTRNFDTELHTKVVLTFSIELILDAYGRFLRAREFDLRKSKEMYKKYIDEVLLGKPGHTPSALKVNLEFYRQNSAYSTSGKLMGFSLSEVWPSPILVQKAVCVCRALYGAALLNS